MITGWILYGLLGALLSHVGISIVMWETWAVMALVLSIDIWSHVCARKRK